MSDTLRPYAAAVALVSAGMIAVAPLGVPDVPAMTPWSVGPAVELTASSDFHILPIDSDSLGNHLGSLISGLDFGNLIGGLDLGNLDFSGLNFSGLEFDGLDLGNLIGGLGNLIGGLDLGNLIGGLSNLIGGLGNLIGGLDLGNLFDGLGDWLSVLMSAFATDFALPF